MTLPDGVRRRHRRSTSEIMEAPRRDTGLPLSLHFGGEGEEEHDMGPSTSQPFRKSTSSSFLDARTHVSFREPTPGPMIRERSPVLPLPSVDPESSHAVGEEGDVVGELASRRESRFGEGLRVFQRRSRSRSRSDSLDHGVGGLLYPGQASGVLPPVEEDVLGQISFSPSPSPGFFDGLSFSGAFPTVAPETSVVDAATARYGPEFGRGLDSAFGFVSGTGESSGTRHDDDQ